MATLSTISIKLDADTMGFGRRLDDARTKVMDFGQKMPTATSGLSSLAAQFGVAGGAAGLAFVAVNKVTDAITNLAKAAANNAIEFTKWGVKLAGDAEQVEASLTVLVGSSTRAQALIGDLRDFAARTPFEMQGLSQNAEMMLGFGMSVDKVMPTLQMLGDIAGGNADRMNRLTLAYSQVQAAGRLMGQDLLQLINAGFNPLQEISKNTGRSLVALKKDMEEGLISFQMVEEAFQSATGEGGRFHDRMEDMSGTFNIQFDMMQEAVRELARTFGETLLPTGTTAIGEITSAVKNMTDGVAASSEIMAAAFGSVVDNLVTIAKLAPEAASALSPKNLLPAQIQPLADMAGWASGKMAGEAFGEISSAVTEEIRLNSKIRELQKELEDRKVRFPEEIKPYQFPEPEALPGPEKTKGKDRMFGDLYKAADRFGRHLGRGIDGGLKNIVKFLEHKDVKQILDPPQAFGRGSAGATQAILAAQRAESKDKPQLKIAQEQLTVAKLMLKAIQGLRGLSPANLGNA